MSIKIDKEIIQLVDDYCPVNLIVINQGCSKNAIYFDIIEERDSITYAETGLNQLSQIVINHFPFVTVKYTPYGVNDDDKQIWMIEFQNLTLDDTIFELADFYCPVGLEMVCPSLMKNGVSCEFVDIFDNTTRAIVGATKIAELIIQKYPFIYYKFILYDKEENEKQMFCIDFFYIG